MKSSIPGSLIQKIQGDYIDSNHRDGVFTFNTIDKDIITGIIYSFLSWAEDSNIINGNSMDISIFLEKDKK